MNMLYRQIASEKATLFREKKQISEKLENKKVKHSYLKQQLQEMTQRWEGERDKNMQFGQLISQVMSQLKSGPKENSPQLGDIRQSIARLSQQNSGFGGLNQSGTGLNTSALLNRNSNVKKTIIGGNRGSVLQRNSNRSSSMYVGGQGGIRNTLANANDLNYVNTILEENHSAAQ